jgi:hypothetical protein
VPREAGLGRHQAARFHQLLGSAAVGLAARGRRSRMSVCGELAADGPEGRPCKAAMLSGLQQSGWSAGHIAQIDIPLAKGH